jgi:hypothetical protein
MVTKVRRELRNSGDYIRIGGFDVVIRNSSASPASLVVRPGVDADSAFCLERQVEPCFQIEKKNQHGIL